MLERVYLKTATKAQAEELPAIVELAALKLRDVAGDLNARFVEREKTIDALMVAVVGGFPATIIAQPGTAKTAIIRSLMEYLPGAGFSHTMLKTTMPDELFGRTSLAGLRVDEERRIIGKGKLQHAAKAFLDEKFKANSATGNALLDVLNDHAFEGEPTQWRVFFSASNEYPEGVEPGTRSDGDSLLALWDRVVIRLRVEYVAAEDAFGSMLFGNALGTPADSLMLDELDALQGWVRNVVIPTDVRTAIMSLRAQMATKGVIVSDRKWRLAVEVVKALALYRGRAYAKTSDLRICQYVLWETPDQQSTIAELTMTLGSPIEAGALAIETALVAKAAQWRAAVGAQKATLQNSLETDLAGHGRAIEKMLTQADGDDEVGEVERVGEMIDSLKREISEETMRRLGMTKR